MGYLLQNGGLGMAGDWIITGGRPLQGRVELPAAKNSVLPLLAAALLCSGPVRLQNVPRLTDVEDCLALLQGVGCTAGWQGAELAVQGQPMRTDLAPEAAGRMRASILFCAPLLARLGRVNTVLPGGCRIGARPIDLHLQGLAQMGVRQLPAAPGQLTLYAPAGLRGAEICLSFPSVGATETLLLAAATAQGQTVLLMVNATLTPVSATVQTLRLQLSLVTVLLAVLATALAFYLSDRVSKPIISISREAEKLGHGGFDAHFSGTGYLEAAQLADTLNYAAAELGKTEELRRELMANISHDLRTPLTMIEGFAEMMRDLPSENTPENAQVIVDEARYLSALVRDILDLSKLESGVQEMNPEPLNLTESVRQMVQRYGALCQSEGFTIRVEAEEDLWVLADALRLQQVL